MNLRSIARTLPNVEDKAGGIEYGNDFCTLAHGVHQRGKTGRLCLLQMFHQM